MQILTTRTKFEVSECKFEPFERDSKHSNSYSSHWKEILAIRMQIGTIWAKFKAFDCKFKPFNRDSKIPNVNSSHLKGIRSIRLQIRTIRKRFEPFERDSNHSNQIPSIECNFERDSKLSDAYSSHWNRIQTIRIQIGTIQTKLEAFKCKF